MLPWRSKTPSKYVGLGLQPEGLTVAVAGRRGEALCVEHLLHRDAVGPEAQALVLKELVGELKLKGAPCVLVLEPSTYQLLQVERPEAVPDEELAEAVRWRIKDMIDFPIDDAVLDVVPLPAGRRADAPQFLYVVAVPEAVIRNAVTQVESAGLELQAIDIAELAVRNLVTLDGAQDRASAIVYLSGQVGLIEEVRNGELFFSRRLGLQGHLIEAGTDDSDQLMDDLALEVQRSLDYFESQYGQGSADHVRLVGTSEAVNDGFMNRAASYLTVPVRALGEDCSLEFSDGIDRQSVSRYASTVGGSLRKLVSAP